MLGAAIRHLAADLKRRLNSRLWSYGLFATAGFLLLCAVGYGLDALHAVLSSRYGHVSASLIIAALLLAAAGVCIIVASRPARPAHSQLTGATLLASLRPSRSTTRSLVAAGAFSAALAAFGLIRRYWRT